MYFHVYPYFSNHISIYLQNGSRGSAGLRKTNSQAVTVIVDNQDIVRRRLAQSGAGGQGVLLFYNNMFIFVVCFYDSPSTSPVPVEF